MLNPDVSVIIPTDHSRRDILASDDELAFVGATTVANPQETRGELLVEQRGAALWVTLNRPSALNALDLEMVHGIGVALDLAETSPDIRALIITGSERAFCAGADLRLLDRAGPGLATFLHSVGDLFCRIESAPLPVIAAVNGLAVAGGLELVLCCDLIFAAETARFGDGHANYGLLPGGGASVRLPRRVGVSLAKELLFTGELVPAQSLASSLVNKVVPDEQLVAEVDRVVEAIATKSPLGLRRMKQLVNDCLEQPTSTGLRLELLAGDEHALSHDMQEGLAAFAEKRKPRFVGD